MTRKMRLLLCASRSFIKSRENIGVLTCLCHNVDVIFVSQHYMVPQSGELAFVRLVIIRKGESEVTQTDRT